MNRQKFLMDNLAFCKSIAEDHYTEPQVREAMKERIAYWEGEIKQFVLQKHREEVMPFILASTNPTVRHLRETYAEELADAAVRYCRFDLQSLSLSYVYGLWEGLFKRRGIGLVTKRVFLERGGVLGYWKEQSSLLGAILTKAGLGQEPLTPSLTQKKFEVMWDKGERDRFFAKCKREGINPNLKAKLLLNTWTNQS